MRLTLPQVQRVAEIERVHGNVMKVSEESGNYEEFMEDEPEGTVLYLCRNCSILFLVVPDGDEPRALHYLG